MSGTRLAFLFVGGLGLCSGTASALAQPSATPSDSLAAAPSDSLVPAPLDSLPAAPPDSLPPALSDSLAGGALDSTATGTTARVGERPQPLAAMHQDRLADRLLDRRMAETLEGVLDLLPDASVRVEGDRGMPAFVSISPLSGVSPEIYVDGVPSSNPADADPALWDLPVLGLESVRAGTRSSGLGWGPPQIRLRTEGGLEGRTRMRTHFSSTAEESYYRAVSLRTPESAREIRFDYGEWKTEQGALFSRSPAVFGAANAGRVKIRRFLTGADLQTDAGRVSFRFGRGTRYHRGTIAANQTIERWNGRLSLGLDRTAGGGHLRVRLYHLDWHVDDRIHADRSDASRLGLRIERRPVGLSGWASSLELERQAGRFEAGTAEELEVSGFLRGRAAQSLRWGRPGGWHAAASAEVAFNELSSDDLGWGGRARLGRALGDRGRVRVGVSRELRDPTMLETEGWVTFETVQPTADGFLYDLTTRRREGAGELPFEIHDRVYLETEARWAGFLLGATVESYRLREGIGWSDEATTGARTVGGLELEVEQARGFVYRPWRWWGIDAFVLAAGHRVLGDLELDASRGAGWPLYATRVQVGAARDFFAPYNRLGFDVVSHVLGPRFDDRLGPIGGSDRESLVEIDVHLWLRIRDAELRLAYDNLLDAELDEVLGTRRRPRQMRLSLRWDFFN